MLAGIIFDLDGVIADTHTMHRQAWRHLLGELGRQVSEKELDFVLEGRKREEILRHFLGSLSAAEVSHYGGRKDELFRQASEQVRAIPGVVDFLCQPDGARGPEAVATSASRRTTHPIIDPLPFGSRFVGRQQIMCGILGFCRLRGNCLKQSWRWRPTMRKTSLSDGLCQLLVFHAASRHYGTGNLVEYPRSMMETRSAC